VTYTNFSWFCWVKRDYLGVGSLLAGRLFSAGNGWAVYVDASNLLTLWTDTNVSTVACPDLTNWTFLAITFDSLTSPTVKFYAAAEGSPVALIGTVALVSSGWAEIGAYEVIIGAATNGNLIGLSAWNGSIDRGSICSTTLTLAQLQTFADGAQAAPTGAVIFWEMTGSEPEPILMLGVASSLLTFGAPTVVEGVLEA
jgi:hypothetical protein